MVEESLLTEDVRALVGATSALVHVRLSERMVERAMDTYLEHHAGAPKAGQQAPGFVLTALEIESGRLDVPDLLPASLLISNEWEFARPLVVGEELVLCTRVADISERFGGRFGYSIDVRTEVEVRDATGAVVARSVRTLTNYDPASARSEGEG
jgi:hypothetical protein